MATQKQINSVLVCPMHAAACPLKPLTYVLKMFSFSSALLREGLETPMSSLGTISLIETHRFFSLIRGWKFKNSWEVKSPPVAGAMKVKRLLCLKVSIRWAAWPSWRGRSPRRKWKSGLNPKGEGVWNISHSTPGVAGTSVERLLLELNESRTDRRDLENQNMGHPWRC